MEEAGLDWSGRMPWEGDEKKPFMVARQKKV
jgi:hypothetical protein